MTAYRRPSGAKFERARIARDEKADPTLLSDSELAAAIYRIQGRRNPRLQGRLSALVAEKLARLASTTAPASE